MSKKQNKNINELRQIMVFQLLSVLALNLFDYDDMPPSVDIDYLENQLMFGNGQVGVYNDQQIGWLGLSAHGTKQLNVYKKPTHYLLNGMNYQKTVERVEMALFKNNQLGYAMTEVLSDYAERISNLMGAQDVNTEVVKTPFIAYGSQKIIASLTTQIKSIRENKLATVGAKNLNDNITILQTGAKIILKELQDHKNSLWGEVLTYLGIDNLNIDKKERNTVDEVNANNEQIGAYADAMLTMRKRGCKEISILSGGEYNPTVKRKIFTSDDVNDLFDQEDDADE